MLSTQNSSFVVHDAKLNLQDEGWPDSPSKIPTLSSIGTTLRASTSSTSSGASPDDTSTDSPDWAGGSHRSPPADFDGQRSLFRGALDDGAMNAGAQLDMDTLPKVEELDEDDLECIKPADVGNEHEHSETGAPVAVPRKRGRPRKHPLPAPGAQVKVTKGRSKTGCITCRRRKKKCDETKPA